MEKLKRRAKSVQDERVETVLNCLTIDQLRTVKSILRIEQKGKTREDIKEAILTSGKALNTVLKTCYNVEVHTPQKHMFLTKFEPVLDVEIKNESFRATRRRIGNISIVHSEADDEKIQVLTEHNITVTELLQVEDRQDYYKKQTSTLRHTLAITIVPLSGTLSIAYPGFSQGRGVKASDRITYEDVIAELVEHLAAKYEIRCAPLLIKQALNELSSAKEGRVILNRSSPVTAKGEMDFRAYLTGNFSVVDVLKNFLGPHFPLTEEQLSQGLEAAIRNSHSQSVIATWVKEKVVTRVTYWEAGAEFLFIWRDVSASNLLVNEIQKLIFSVEGILSSPDTESIWKLLASTQANLVITTSQIATTCGKSADVVREIIKQAVTASLFKPVFRLKTRALIPEYPNEWIEDLAPIWKVFVTEDGHEIDGADPSMIEIGFKRSESVAPESVND